MNGLRETGRRDDPGGRTSVPSSTGASEVRAGRKLRKLWVPGLVLLAILGLLAWSRVGLLGLPRLPTDLTLEATGLAQLTEMKQLNNFLWSNSGSSSNSESSAASPGPPAVLLVHSGIAAYHRGETTGALEQMRNGIRLDPNNLVLANAYRMVVFEMRRDFLRAARQELSLTPQFPAHLEHQPIRFFEELDREHSTRETKLHLALSWVDEMLLFPALEIKAPSSVQAVNLLSEVVENSSPNYVPALFARGLNHLHRPARLVWPESIKAPANAAARDLAKCVAIGRHFTAGSARLQATLALSLGDAYVKAGKNDLARSWWQIAQNLCREDELQASVRRRYGWQNEEIVDRLEEELDRSRSQLDRPMTDLALMWN